MGPVLYIALYPLLFEYELLFFVENEFLDFWYTTLYLTTFYFFTP